MQISKNKKYQYLFFFILTIYTIFNGGNSNISIQFNFILVSLLFLFCLKDKNYKLHFNIFCKKSKIQIVFYFLFLSYLIFQIIPLPIEVLKFFSFEKFNIIKKLNFNTSLSAISLSPTNSFFQFLNFVTLFMSVLIIKMIFYTERHQYRFYLFLSFFGAIISFFAVVLYLNGNPDLFFLKKNFYKDSSTGFFTNRTVFSIFLLFCFIASLQYLKKENFKKKNDNFFIKVYTRLAIIFITIGIVTSFSRIGNFLFFITLLFYLIETFYLDKTKNRSFKYIILLIILFDVFIVGYYFGASELLNRFLFLNEELVLTISKDQNFTRLDIINFGFRSFKDYYIFGYGAGGFETLFQLNFLDSGNKFANHAHGDLVEFVGEFGLVGSFLILVVILIFFLKKEFISFVNILLTSYLIIILFFDFSFHIPLIQLLFINFFLLNKKSAHLKKF